MARRTRRKKIRCNQTYNRSKESFFEKINISFDLDPETRRWIFVIIIFAVALISIFAIFNQAGVFGRFIKDLLQIFIGWGFPAVPIILLVIGILLINPERYYLRGVNWLGLFLFIISAAGFLHLFKNNYGLTEAALEGQGGGVIGLAMSYPLLKIMGLWASGVVLIAVWIISVLLIFETSLERIFERFKFSSWLIEKIRNFSKRLKEEETGEQLDFEAKEINEPEVLEGDQGLGLKTEDQQDLVGVKIGEDKKQSELFPKTKKHYPKINLPLDLLTGKISQPTARDIHSAQETIKKTLNNFGIEVEMGEVNIGPTVTQFTFRPADGVKLSKILALTNDLALALAAHPIRIEAPIPGRSLVGIEVPNQKVALVSLKEILMSKEYKEITSKLTIALGKDVAGQAWLADLDRMPHLLIAGATGSGKTVALNAIIVSLLYHNQPSDLKFILVDPKRVELPVYNNIPYLLTPVITDVKKTINALHWVIKEMDQRFYLLSRSGKRNINVYNQSVSEDKRMPYIVVIVDELADLMAVAAAEVETAIIRLAQMARAVGIHLVLATQRPSVDVITGLIKANITNRIAFSVASQIDSRTILDYSGAEKLLGRGDMLFLSPEIGKPKRLQGAYVTDEEIERVVGYLKKFSRPDYDETIVQKMIDDVQANSYDLQSDELLPEAREIIISNQKGSASFLQRRMRIGYARAARLIDLLEKEGVVGPADGAKPREVLVRKEEYFGEEFSEEVEGVDDEDYNDEQGSEDDYNEELEEEK